MIWQAGEARRHYHRQDEHGRVRDGVRERQLRVRSCQEHLPLRPCLQPAGLQVVLPKKNVFFNAVF